MFVLHQKPDGSRLISFLLSIGILLTAGTALMTWLISGEIHLFSITGIVLSVLLIFIELAWPNSILPVYKFWRTSQILFSKMLQWWIAAVCFYTVVLPVGVAGKVRQFKKPVNSNSMWHERSGLNENTYRSQHRLENKNSDGKDSWTGYYLEWSTNTRNKWAIFLTPFLALLKIHKVDEEKKTSDNIYTLY